MQKIIACCGQASRNGFEYVWIDTCCIDKTNRTELSEAINSMFNWYRCAIGCYAYLSDVSIALSDHPELVDRKVSQSKWFTGGWTLQELLAPLSVVFLDSQWETIGTKENLSRLISNVTKIPTSILLNCAVEQVSVAQIMYWASKRKTTRVEDRAYSLIGLFNVNMPMIYGEGEKAFTRLQHEIIKIFDDQSLFTWTGWRGDRGAVARYPDEFEAYGTVKQHPSSPGQFKPRFSTTNRGLRMELHLNSTSSPEPAVAYLDCYSDDGRYLGIFLSRVSGNYFVRSGTSLWQGERVVCEKDPVEIYIIDPAVIKFDIERSLPSKILCKKISATFWLLAKFCYELRESLPHTAEYMWRGSQFSRTLDLSLD